MLNLAITQPVMPVVFALPDSLIRKSGGVEPELGRTRQGHHLGVSSPAGFCPARW